MRNQLALLAVLAVLASAALPPQVPIIGVYTEDCEEFDGPIKEGTTYIAASYVKNLEMAGAQVIPIFYNSKKEQLLDLLSKINGVFLPGGEMPIDRDNIWTSNIQVILDYATEQNDKGNPYPIWATCLSYEAIMYLYSGRKDNMTVLTHVEGQVGVPGALIIKNNNSALIKSLTASEYKDVTTGDGLLWFHQSWSVTIETYQNTEGINKFWKLVSTSMTVKGVEQVSTVEAYNYPYWMTQYHPEKNSYEWRIAPKRTYNAISVEQKFINQFVKVARLNRNRMDEDEWKAKAIYNYKPIFTPDDFYFVQIYTFDESNL
jgi:gamma-glutamyl hydrolase